MRAGFLRNLSASALQLALNQALGFLLFLVLSRELTKTDFGTLSWCLSLLLLTFNILGFGIDQILIRTTAAGKEEEDLVPLFTVHLLIWGGATLLLLTLVGLTATGAVAWLLPVLALGKWAITLALPLKSWAAGRERFSLLLRLSLPAAVLKAVAALLLALTGRLTLTHLAIALVAAEALEAGLAFFRLRRQFPLSRLLRPCFPRYPALLREALPQLGVVVFSTALLRFDQVLLGWLRLPAELAEYSFAMKVYELATLPLLVVAPLLLPRLSRQAATPNDRTLIPLLRAEMLLAFGALLLLNLFWTPVADAVSGGKYGRVNTGVVFWLSLCLPLAYLNHYFWTLGFAAGRHRAFFRWIALTFCVNLTAGLLLIPRYGTEGAAAGFFVAAAVQCVGYHHIARPAAMPAVWRTAAICSTGSMALLLLVRWVPAAGAWSAGAALALFALLLFGTRELGRSEYRWLRRSPRA